jgi:uncharacterized protein YndB with AHSA1/START domain
LGPQAARRKVTLERSFNASLEEVWDLWTTKEGIESWWGPEGFTVQVRNLDLRPGGDLVYAMTATDPEQIEFMKKAGMPLTTESRAVYSDVIPRRHLAYTQGADFIPNVKPYDIATTVDFQVEGNSVRMILTFDAMHDEQWTDMAVKGREGELRKLEKLLAR